MHELGRHVEFELLDLDRLADDELEEEFVDTLEVRPSWVHLLLLVDARLGEIQFVLVYARQWAEDVLFDHLHGLVHVWNDGADYVFLVTQHGLKLLDGVETLSLHITEIRKG